MKRYNLEYIQQLAKIKGGKCLSKEYTDFMHLHKWQCKKGHTFEATPMVVKAGYWCRRCVEEERVNTSLAHLKKHAISKGGKLLSDSYQNRQIKLNWQCAKGHKWSANAHSILNEKSWCPDCAGNKKFTLEQVKQVGIARGGKCLSKTYKDALTDMLWQCDKGHLWLAPVGRINRGEWCPTCGYEKKAADRRYTIKEINKVAKLHGGKLISTEYLRMADHIEWECKKGHRWFASLTMVKNYFAWCPVCLPKRKDKAEHRIKMQEKYGHKLEV